MASTAMIPRVFLISNMGEPPPHKGPVTSGTETANLRCTAGKPPPAPPPQRREHAARGLYVNWHRSMPHERVAAEATARYATPPITSLAARLARRSRAFDDHHVEVGGAQAVVARLLVLRRVVEPLRRLDVRKFAHHDALERGVALQRRLVAAADQEAAVVLGVRRAGALRVLLVLLGVLDVHHGNDISGHPTLLLGNENGSAAQG